jgi:dienelactone hydrolase
MYRTLLLLFLLASGILERSTWAQQNTIVQGKSLVTLTVREQPIEVYCYKPTSFKGKRLIIVMHGINRNADEYRDHAVSMAERFDALIVAPKFDKSRFPSIKYNRGGILTEDKQPVPERDWTYQLIPEIVQQIRHRESQPALPFWIIGHSAGGQFIARMSAFVNIGAQRMVAANPGSQLFPTRKLPFGYGFGELPESLSNDQRIRDYLAAPLTIYLGTGDDHADENFDDSPEAMQQGLGRFQRGVACFEMAKKLAEDRKWDFGWRIVTAEGVEHDHKAMFDHPQCETALFGLK